MFITHHSVYGKERTDCVDWFNIVFDNERREQFFLSSQSDERDPPSRGRVGIWIGEWDEGWMNVCITCKT